MDRYRILLLASASILLTICTAAGMTGVHFYRIACIAAEKAVIAEGDGPWVRCNTHFVVNWSTIGVPGSLAPHWMFRFRNPHRDSESRRIYVSAFGTRSFCYNEFPGL